MKIQPKGLDVGTCMLITASKRDDESVEFKEQVDAYFTMASSEESKNMLEMLGVPYIEKRGKISVLGNESRRFANMLKQEIKRPMQTGALNKQDIEALGMLTSLMENLLGDGGGATLVYSATSQPLDSTMNLDYHKAQIESILKGLNYNPKPIQEARAIALSELSDTRFSGISISCGSGTTTVWLGAYGVDNPKYQFSIGIGGDWIDHNASDNFAGLTRTKVQTIKEKGIRIKDQISQKELEELEGNPLLEAQARAALSIYYRKYIENIIKGIKYKLDIEQLPEFEEAVPVVVAGGTSLPEDFMDVFKEEWNKAKISLDISEFRRAKDPSRAVARGCLIAAELEDKKK